MSTSFEIYDLLDSSEIDNKYDKIQSLIESDPSILQSTDFFGKNPLHHACDTSHVTLRIVQLLLNGRPESTSQPNRHGMLPIHYLCKNKIIEETVSVDILSLLLEASPESVQREASGRELPIHKAAWYGMSPEFLKLLVLAYPESISIPGGGNSMLPIHFACDSHNRRLDTVKFLLDIHPESINIEDSEGWLPIHHAASSNNNGPQKADVIKYLLMRDPTYASKLTEDGKTPLHVACLYVPDLTTVQLLFDVYPKALLETDQGGNTPLELSRQDAVDVIAFLETQLVYAEKSQDMNALSTLDENSWSPLHHAVKNNAPLGSIKLLVEGNTMAVRVPDNNMAFPLHIACEFSSFKVVKYLMDMLDESMKNHLDANDDSILHYACRGGNCEVVKYLLDKQSPHVSKRNADEKLPIHLFCQFGLPPNSLEHTDTLFRLLLAFPETL